VGVYFLYFICRGFSGGELRFFICRCRKEDVKMLELGNMLGISHPSRDRVGYGTPVTRGASSKVADSPKISDDEQREIDDARWSALYADAVPSKARQIAEIAAAISEKLNEIRKLIKEVGSSNNLREELAKMQKELEKRSHYGQTDDTQQDAQYAKAVSSKAHQVEKIVAAMDEKLNRIKESYRTTDSPDNSGQMVDQPLPIYQNSQGESSQMGDSGFTMDIVA
jgi:hypothetical protein